MSQSQNKSKIFETDHNHIIALPKLNDTDANCLFSKFSKGISLFLIDQNGPKENKVLESDQIPSSYLKTNTWKFENKNIWLAPPPGNIIQDLKTNKILNQNIKNKLSTFKNTLSFVNNKRRKQYMSKRKDDEKTLDIQKVNPTDSFKLNTMSPYVNCK